MKELKKIMAAIDFSDYSLEVMETCEMLCRKIGAELVLVNVINQKELNAIKALERFLGDRISIEDVVNKQKLERTDRMHILIQQFGIKDIAYTIVFRVGIPYEELIKVAEDEEAQLVVIGPKGRSDVPGILLGSSAEKLFRHCPVPILSLRGTQHSRAK